MSHHDTRHPRPGFEKQNWFRGGPNVDGASPGYPPAPTPALLFTWDTRPFPDGRNTLRLRVVRNDGNYMEWYTQVVIANG